MAGPRPPGSLVRLHYDGWGAPLEAGDYLRTATTGRLYLIESVRIQARGKWAGRQHLRAVVMEPGHDTGDARVELIAWYPR